MVTEYRPVDGAIQAGFPLQSGTVRFIAEDVRKERTGVHAKVTIGFERTLLAFDNFNVERQEDRTRLSNSAHKGLGESVQLECHPTVLRHELDMFCHGLWKAKVSTLEVEDLAGNYQPNGVRMVLAPYIIEGGGTILFGQPGRGKSTTAMLMARCADSGISTYWNPREEVRVLYVNLERSAESMAHRLACINECVGMDRELPMLFLNARGRSLFDVQDSIRFAVRQRGVNLLVLDSISRAGAGDLNENQSGNKVIDLMNDLCPTWLAIGHSPRGDDTHLYGSQMFDAGADVLVALASEKKPDGTVGVLLKVEKANDMAFPEPRALAFEYDASGLCGVRDAREGEFFALDERTFNAAPRNVLEEAKTLLQEGTEWTLSDMAKELGGADMSYLSAGLRRDPHVSVRRDGKYARYSWKGEE